MAGVVGAALRGFGKALGKIGRKASKVSDKTVGNITMGAIGAGVVGGGEALKRKKKKSKAPMFRNKKEFEAKKKSKSSGQNMYGPKGGNKYPAGSKPVK